MISYLLIINSPFRFTLHIIGNLFILILYLIHKYSVQWASKVLISSKNCYFNKLSVCLVCRGCSLISYTILE